MARFLATLLCIGIGPATLAGEVTSLVFLPEGLLVAGNTDGNLHFLDAETGKETKHLEAHAGGVFGLALSADGKLLASCGADHKVKLWKITNRQDTPIKEERIFEGHEKEVVAVAFSPDGNLLASGGYDPAIRLWETATGKTLKQFEGQKGRTTSLAFFPDGNKLASAGNGKFEFPIFQDDKIHFWDVNAGKLLETIAQEGHQLALTPDGRRLAAVRDYSTSYKKKIRTTNIEVHTEMALWDTARGRELHQFKEHQQTLALSPDGKWLAMGWGSGLHRNDRNWLYQLPQSDKGIQIFELASGKPVLWLKVGTEDAAVLAFSPDSTRLAAGAQTGKVKIVSVGLDSWQPGRRLKVDALDDLWKLLADEDASVAYEAIGMFVAKGDAAAAFLKERTAPVAPLGPKLRKLIGDLESQNFRIRDSAFRELQRLGGAAELELRHSLATKPGLEVELRLKKLISAMPVQALTAEEIRQSRAVVALCKIGTAAARRQLDVLAAGEPTAWLTQEAREGLRFLSGR